MIVLFSLQFLYFYFQFLSIIDPAILNGFTIANEVTVGILVLAGQL
mgnify:CR=1 FL=1|jgi:uncharacterized membrane protein (DUF485 family)